MEPPGDARRPAGDLAAADPDAECQDPGSIIYCESQSLGETLPLVGTGSALNYRSDRSPGRLAVLDVPLIDDDIPESLKRIEATVAVAGRRYSHVVEDSELEGNDSWQMTWDGEDAFGREVSGGQQATITLTYVYAAAGYQGAAPGVNRSFGVPGGGGGLSASTRMGEVEVSDKLPTPPRTLGSDRPGAGWLDNDPASHLRPGD